ncbi:beta-fructofuranosidase [Aureococcus anophagefferens]|nr:beta-fructofuranosidase [Aureococcus anophagefferens]
MKATLVLASAAASEELLWTTTCFDKPGGTSGDCAPGFEFCGEPFEDAPTFHIMDQHGCGENDPNGPVFDPVHGVFHHFYQIHLAIPPGGGPDYGHVVSKNLVEWAPLPVAIWNGVDASNGKPTPYDARAIFTGSAAVVDGAGPGGAAGVVQIYPACAKETWANCSSGTNLALAVPADYAGDELLVHWTKPGYNPVVENTQRDPSTPWKTSAGEWRLRTYDSMVYGAASDAAFSRANGTPSASRRTCAPASARRSTSCRLPRRASSADDAGPLPTHVHKTSCGGDWWQLGTYAEGAPKALGGFAATPGWEAEFAQRRTRVIQLRFNLEIDVGNFYASKDADYPSLDGAHRRVNYGWATVPPQSAQTLPREITFNAAARLLQQYPVDEIAKLRGAAVVVDDDVTVDGAHAIDVPGNVTKASELLATFELPTVKATLSATVGDLECSVDYDPGAGGAYADHAVRCGGKNTTLRLLATETSLEMRIFADATFAETNFSVYPMKAIWVDEAAVRATPRSYAGWSA